ncbi:hypothetical protein GCM10018773_61930 [Streptomyces candidus]|nr:hypothetical protein GCM10018773_61930 [Streptomyces candidus]
MAFGHGAEKIRPYRAAAIAVGPSKALRAGARPCGAKENGLRPFEKQRLRYSYKADEAPKKGAS